LIERRERFGRALLLSPVKARHTAQVIVIVGVEFLGRFVFRALDLRTLELRSDRADDARRQFIMLSTSFRAAWLS
jgi:hypothetical protein